MTIIILFIVILIGYQIIKPKKPKVTAFDLFLMEKYEQSKRKSDMIPTYISPLEVKATIINETKPSVQEDEKEIDKEPTLDDVEFVKDLYLGMIKYNKYADAGLRKEACEALDVTEFQLDEMLKNFKIIKKK